MSTQPPQANYSLYTIPMAWILSLTPHIYAITLHNINSPKAKFDNCSPRTLVPSLQANQALTQETKDRIVRAEAAQNNGYENIGFFAASVVAANAAGVDGWWLNTLSFTYLGSRVVYNVLYIGGVGGTRSAVFFGGVGIIFSLYVMAGNNVRDGVL